jgi:hypothetical protein
MDVNFMTAYVVLIASRKQKEFGKKGEADKSSIVYVMCTDCSLMIVFAFRKQNTYRCCYLRAV